MHIRIAQWRIELTTTFFWQFFVPKVYSWFLKIGKMILNNNLLFIWSIWVSGNWWIIENIIWMQISSVSEAGRAKVNDCIISKLINTDNKISTLLLLEDFVLIFLLWLLSVACISYQSWSWQSPWTGPGAVLQRNKNFVLRRFSVIVICLLKGS